MQSDQAACAVKLNVDYKTKVLGVHMFFCSVHSCSNSAHQGWKPKPIEKRSASKKFNKAKAGKTWGKWKQAGFKVDGHMTSPRYDGRMTGMRLYHNSGQLTLQLKTEF